MPCFERLRSFKNVQELMFFYELDPPPCMAHVSTAVACLVQKP